MNFFHKVRIKSRSLASFYFFQSLGMPRIRDEQISKSILKKFLPKNPVIIDCGAYDGADSVELARILNGNVHAFEPVPEIYERLKLNTKKYPRIKCYNLALSNQTGFQNFYLSEGGSDASSSLLEPKDHLVDHPETRFVKGEQVRTFTLDDWALEYKVPVVDLLWLDMQGFEQRMISESKSVLSSVKVIYSEVSVKETYSQASLYPDYRKFLENLGFKVVIEAIPTGWDMGNVLFVRK